MAADATLIVGPSWVGDMVMAQSLFKVMRQQSPDTAIDILAPQWSLPIIDRMPEIRRGITMPLGHGELQLGTRRRLGKSLQGQYRQAIVLPNSLKSALIPFFAGIETRTGWRGEMRYGLLNDVRKLDKEHYPLMVERFVALALTPGAVLPDPVPRPALQVNAEIARKLLHEQGLQQPVLALCPGAEFGPAKRWPDRHYAQVASHFISKGWQIVIMGSAKDFPVGQSLLSALPPTAAERCRNLCGKTSLGQAIDILSQVEAVVSNDSGLMHIAAALGRPLAVVYGSTSPGFTPPLSDCVVIEQLQVDCGPCFQRECPEGHLKCLVDLNPRRVIASLEQLLEGIA